MPKFLDIEVISPMTKYKFNKNYKYYLIVTGAVAYPYPENAVILSKIKIDNIDKITKNIRGFLINKSVIINSYQYPKITLNLFAYDNVNDIISLIFTSVLDYDSYEFNSKLKIELKRTKNINGLYFDDSSFVLEQFFDVEFFYPNDICILFFSKTEYQSNSQELDYQMKRTIIPIIIPTTSSLFENDITVFNRYNQILTKELVPEEIKDNFQNDLKDFKKYYLHISNYLKNGKFNYWRKNYSYKMIINNRPTKFDPYINNIVLSPLEGRVRGFNINPSLKFNFFNQETLVHDLVPKFYEINSGSGFISRITPRDYNKIYVPYNASLKEIMINKNKNQIMLRFDSNYYMPFDVHERDLASVILGNFTHHGVGPGAGNRAHPELLEPQPKIKLIYYMILINPSKDSVELSNQKLKNFNYLSKDENSVHKIPPIWLEQGEEIAKFNNNVGYVVTMFNRPLDFASDIKYYSKFDISNNERKQIDVFVKLRDIIGMLQ